MVIDIIYKLYCEYKCCALIGITDNVFSESVVCRAGVVHC